MNDNASLEALLSKLLPRQECNTQYSTERDTTGEVQHALGSLGIGSDTAWWKEALGGERSDDAEETAPEGRQPGSCAADRGGEDFWCPAVKDCVEH